ncbi:hypothetical protein ACFSTC_22800 [Nonomuraea ferruginea]
MPGHDRPRYSRPHGHPVMTDHRAAFDASITFGNGGDLTVHDFRVDVPSPGVTEDEIAALFVASLGLLMTDAVELSNVRVFPEPHKGTRGGPSDRTAPRGLPRPHPPSRHARHPPGTPCRRSRSSGAHGYRSRRSRSCRSLRGGFD